MEPWFVFAVYLLHFSLLAQIATGDVTCEAPKNDGKNDCEDGAYINICGVCVGGRTGREAQHGVDRCGVCFGGDACVGCDGQPHSGAALDACGRCLARDDPSWNECVRIARLSPAMLDIAVQRVNTVNLRGANLNRTNVPDINCTLAPQDMAPKIEMITVEDDVIQLEIIIGEQQGIFLLQCNSSAVPNLTAPNLTLSLVNSKNLSVSSVSPTVASIEKSFQPVLTVPNVMGHSNALCFVRAEGSEYTKILHPTSIEGAKIICSNYTAKQAHVLEIGAVFTEDAALEKNITAATGKVTIKAPKPIMKEAILTNDLQYIHVTFDQNVEGPKECSKIMSSYSISLLGKEPQCSFTANQLIIKLGPNPAINSNTQLQLAKDCQIYRANSDNKLCLSATGNIQLHTPTIQAARPSYRVSAPSIVCHEGTTKASSSATSNYVPSFVRLVPSNGQDLRYNWEVTVPNMSQIPNRGQAENLRVWRNIRGMAREMKKITDQTSGNQFPLNSSLFRPGMEYELSVVGTNILGMKGEKKTFSVHIDDTNNSVDVLLLGPDIVFIDADYYVDVKVFTCNETLLTNDLMYEWSITDNVEIDTDLQRGKRFHLPAGTLIAGKKYVLSCVVKSSEPDSSILGNSSLTIEAIQRGITAILATSEQTLGTGQSLYLDASASDDPNKKKGDIKFQWCCYTTSGKHCTLPGPGNSQNLQDKYSSEFKSSKLIIPPRSLPIGEYNFTVHVYKDENDTGSAWTKVIVVPGSPPMVNVTPDVKHRIVDPSEGVTIQAEVTDIKPGCHIWWEVAQETGYQYFDLQGSVGLGDVVKITEEEGNSGQPRELPLFIPGHTGSWPGLLGDTKYKLRLTATCPLEGNNMKQVAGYADVIIETNTPPVTKPLQVVPDHGEALRTQFEFSTDEAYDSVSDMPLQYNFGYRVSDEETNIFSSSNEDLKAYTLLPGGDVESRTETFITPILQVCDSHKLCTISEGPKVKTTAPNQLTSEEVETIMKMLTNYMTSGQYTEALSLIKVSLQTLKKMNDDILYNKALQQVESLLVEELRIRRERLKDNPSTIQDSLDFTNMALTAIRELPMSNHILQELFEFKDDIVNVINNSIHGAAYRLKRSVWGKKERQKRNAPNSLLIKMKTVKKYVDNVLNMYELMIRSSNPNTIMKGIQALLKEIETILKMICYAASPGRSEIFSGSMVVLKVEKYINKIMLTGKEIRLLEKTRPPTVPKRSFIKVSVNTLETTDSLICFGNTLFLKDFLGMSKNNTDIFSDLSREDIVNGVWLINSNGSVLDTAPNQLRLSIENDTSKATTPLFQCSAWQNGWKTGLCKTLGTSEYRAYVDCNCAPSTFYRLLEKESDTTFTETTIISTSADTSALSTISTRSSFTSTTQMDSNSSAFITSDYHLTNDEVNSIMKTLENHLGRGKYSEALSIIKNVLHTLKKNNDGLFKKALQQVEEKLLQEIKIRQERLKYSTNAFQDNLDFSNMALSVVKKLPVSDKFLKKLFDFKEMLSNIMGTNKYQLGSIVQNTVQRKFKRSSDNVDYDVKELKEWLAYHDQFISERLNRPGHSIEGSLFKLLLSSTDRLMMCRSASPGKPEIFGGRMIAHKWESFLNIYEIPEKIYLLEKVVPATESTVSFMKLSNESFMGLTFPVCIGRSLFPIDVLEIVKNNSDFSIDISRTVMVYEIWLYDNHRNKVPSREIRLRLPIPKKQNTIKNSIFQCAAWQDGWKRELCTTLGPSENGTLVDCDCTPNTHYYRLIEDEMITTTISSASSTTPTTTTTTSSSTSSNARTFMDMKKVKVLMGNIIFLNERLIKTSVPEKVKAGVKAWLRESELQVMCKAASPGKPEIIGGSMVAFKWEKYTSRQKISEEIYLLEKVVPPTESTVSFVKLSPDLLMTISLPVCIGNTLFSFDILEILKNNSDFHIDFSRMVHRVWLVDTNGNITTIENVKLPIRLRLPIPKKRRTIEKPIFQCAAWEDGWRSDLCTTLNPAENSTFVDCDCTAHTYYSVREEELITTTISTASITTPTSATANSAATFPTTTVANIVLKTLENHLGRRNYSEALLMIIRSLKSLRNMNNEDTYNKTVQDIEEILLREIKIRQQRLQNKQTAFDDNLDFLNMALSTIKELPVSDNFLQKLFDFKEILTYTMYEQNYHLRLNVRNTQERRFKRDTPTMTFKNVKQVKELVETFISLNERMINTSDPKPGIKALLRESDLLVMCNAVTPGKSEIIGSSMAAFKWEKFTNKKRLSEEIYLLEKVLEPVESAVSFIKLSPDLLTTAIFPMCIINTLLRLDFLEILKNNSASHIDFSREVKVHRVSLVDANGNITTIDNVQSPTRLRLPIPEKGSTIENSIFKCAAWRDGWKTELCTTLDPFEKKALVECDCTAHTYYRVTEEELITTTTPTTTSPTTTTTPTTITTTAPTTTTTTETTTASTSSAAPTTTIPSTIPTTTTLASTTTITTTTTPSTTVTTSTLATTTLKPTPTKKPLIIAPLQSNIPEGTPTSEPRYNVSFSIKEDYEETVGKQEESFKATLQNQILNEINKFKKMPVKMIKEIRISPGSIIVKMTLVDTEEMSAEKIIPVIRQIIGSGKLNLHGLDNKALDVPVQNVQVVENYSHEDSKVITYAVGGTVGASTCAVVGLLIIAVVYRRRKEKERMRKFQASAQSKIPTYRKFEYEESIDGTEASLAQYRCGYPTTGTVSTMMGFGMLTGLGTQLNIIPLRRYDDQNNTLQTSYNSKSTKKLKNTEGHADSGLLDNEQHASRSITKRKKKDRSKRSVSLVSLDNLPGTPTDENR